MSTPGQPLGSFVIESGGAAGDIGRYVTLRKKTATPIECLQPVEAIGVNGLQAAGVAPVLVRADMLRERCTYELFITAACAQRNPTTAVGRT
jgi:hypothetical protein